MEGERRAILPPFHIGGELGPTECEKEEEREREGGV